MDNITLGQIKDILLWIVVIVGAIGTLYKLLMTGFGNLIQPIKDDIKNERIERLKSDITTFLYIIDKDELSGDQTTRFWEEYDMYIKMGGNTWIKERVEKLKKENKI